MLWTCVCKLAAHVGSGTSLEYPLGLKIGNKPPNLKIPNASAVFEQPNISIGTQNCRHFRDANSHRHIPIKALAESNPSLSCCAVSANQRNAVSHSHCVVCVSEMPQNATSTLFTRLHASRVLEQPVEMSQQPPMSQFSNSTAC